MTRDQIVNLVLLVVSLAVVTWAIGPEVVACFRELFSPSSRARRVPAPGSDAPASELSPLVSTRAPEPAGGTQLTGAAAGETPGGERGPGIADSLCTRLTLCTSAPDVPGLAQEAGVGAPRGTGGNPVNAGGERKHLEAGAGPASAHRNHLMGSANSDLEKLGSTRGRPAERTSGVLATPPNFTGAASSTRELRGAVQVGRHTAPSTAGDPASAHHSEANADDAGSAASLAAEAMHQEEAAADRVRPRGICPAEVVEAEMTGTLAPGPAPVAAGAASTLTGAATTVAGLGGSGRVGRAPASAHPHSSGPDDLTLQDRPLKNVHVRVSDGACACAANRCEAGAEETS